LTDTSIFLYLKILGGFTISLVGILAWMVITIANPEPTDQNAMMNHGVSQGLPKEQECVSRLQ